MVHPFQPIGPPYWHDRTVWLIGGGPSINALPGDFVDRLTGLTVGCNRSAYRFGQCDILFSLDMHYARMCASEIESFLAAGGFAYLAAPPNDKRHTTMPDRVHYLVRRRGSGLSRDARDINGSNSGFGALGLAYLKQARDIRLIGYDMSVVAGGKTHAHEGYRWSSRNVAKMMDRWAGAFDGAARQLTEAGATVINYTGDPPSKIRSFGTRPIEEVLEYVA